MLSLDSNELFNVPLEFEKREMYSEFVKLVFKYLCGGVSSYQNLTYSIKINIVGCFLPASFACGVEA